MTCEVCKTVGHEHLRLSVRMSAAELDAYCGDVCPEPVLFACHACADNTHAVYFNRRSIALVGAPA